RELKVCGLSLSAQNPIWLGRRFAEPTACPASLTGLLSMASRARSYGCRQSIQANTRRSVHKGGGGCRLPSALLPCGPGVLIHTQEFQFQKNQKTHLSVPCSVAIIRLPALELTNKLLDGT